MELKGTGYLYNWGQGSSGENYIPSELINTQFDKILGAGNSFNVAQVADIPPAPVISPFIEEILKPKDSFSSGRFNFVFFNSNEQISTLNKLELFSSFSGSGSSPLTSGNNFIGKVILGVEGGQTGTINNRALVSLGQTLGTGSGRYLYPQDTFVTIKKNNLLYKSYETWSGDYGLFTGNNFTGYFVGNTFIPFSGLDGGAIIKDSVVPNTANSLNFYEVEYGTKNPIQSNRLVGQKILFKDLNTESPTYEIISPTASKVWSAYDIREGMTNDTKNVFAYAFEFVDFLTTKDSGIIVTSGGQDKTASQYLNSLSAPILTSGFSNSFTNYIGYCFSTKECPDAKEVENVIECWTGSDVNSVEYAQFVSGILKKYSSKEYVNDIDASTNLVISNAVTVSGFFIYQTGEIYYNNFVSGDKISFNLYPFDYTGFYKSYHLNNNPVYPTTGFILSYPQDFTNINTLVNTLNNRLNNINYNVWYPYDCLAGTSTGIYITGGLMSFEIFSGSGAATPSDKNFNNIIQYKSLRNYSSGFSLNLNLVDRSQSVQDLWFDKKVFKKGFSYLIPNVVELQGLSGNNWVVLDRRSGLYKALTGLESKSVPLNIDPSLFGLSGKYLSSESVTGVSEGLPEEEFKEITISGGFRVLQQFTQTTYNNAPPYCSVNTLERDILITQPTGWSPSVKDPCKFQPPDEKDKEEESEQDGGGGDEELAEFLLNVRRTGWLFQPTNEYLTCLTNPDDNLSRIQFPSYRFVMRELSGVLPKEENLFIQPTNEIYITNINLFSLKSGSIPVMTGDAKCIVGSKYTLDVSDIVAIPFDSDFQYSIENESRSGVFKALNYPIVYPYKSFFPTGNNISGINIQSPVSVTGYFQIGGIDGISQPLFTGGQLSIQISTGSSLQWRSGKFVRWESSVDNNIFSGFRLYNSGIEYFSGIATGDGGLGATLYTGSLPINSKYFRVVQPGSGSDEIRISFTGQSGFYDLPYVKFVNESGRLIGNITGLVNGTFTGCGTISHTFGEKYFYDPINKSVSFSKDVSKNICKGGILSGNFTTVKDFVINQELYLGGRFDSIPPQYAQIISGGIFTGILSGVNYVQNNATGLYKLTGFVSGVSNSGYFNFNTGVTGSGLYINDDIYPYYPIATGYKQASGTITIDYNNISVFNFITINNNSITYHNNTGIYFAPDYFYNTDSLIQIINNSPSLFSCSGTKLSSSGILLTANNFSLGSEGNSITITGNNSGFKFSSSTLTGGKTLYPRLYPTTIFSGTAIGSAIATGFYYQIGSGSITGKVPTFTGTRSFTGIWGFQTGQDFDLISFLGNNLIVGNNKYFDTKTFEDDTNLIQVLVQYENQLGTNEDNILDVANLKINDLNYNLIFPTGDPDITGTYNIGITGIKFL